MKKIATSVAIGVIIVAALSLNFINYPSLRVSSAAPASAGAADAKSESQFRSEAARYDAAIRAIGAIATTKLDTVGDLKKALAVLEFEHQNLQFRFSKLVVLALADATFSNTVKAKTASGREAAEAFLSELKADPKAIFKLNGAEPLKTRLQRSDEADAKTLRRVADRLKAIAEKANGGKALLPVTSGRPTAIAYEERLERALVQERLLRAVCCPQTFPCF